MRSEQGPSSTKLVIWDLTKNPVHWIAAHCSEVHCTVVHCSTVKCSEVKCSVVQCSTVQYSIVQCWSMQWSRLHAVKFCAVQCSAVRSEMAASDGPLIQIHHWLMTEPHWNLLYSTLLYSAKLQFMHRILTYFKGFRDAYIHLGIHGYLYTFRD